MLFYSATTIARRCRSPELIDRLGFFGLDLGALAVGGRLVRFAGGPLPVHGFVKLD